MTTSSFLQTFARRRVRLAALVFAAIAPFTAFIAYQALDIRERRIDEALSRAHQYARLGSDSFEDAIAEVRAVLELASQISDVTSGSPDACRAFLASVDRARRWSNGMWVVGEDGRVRCSTVANGIGLDLSDSEAYRRALSASGFHVSDFFIGKLRKLPLAVATLPARNAATGERVLLSVTLDLSWFDRLAAKLGQHADAQILLLDSKGTLLSSYPADKTVVGRSFADHSSVLNMPSGPQGQFEDTRIDGTKALWGYVSLSGTHMRLAVNFERAVILAHVNRGTLQALALFGLVAVAIGMLIWLAGNRFFASPMRELDDLLKATLENMDQGLIVVDKHDTLPICNRRAMELLDLPPELMASRPTSNAVIAFQRNRGEFDNVSDDIRGHLQPRPQGDTHHTYERQRSNGTTIEVRTVPFADGGVVRTYTDVTAHRHAERQLAEQNERLAEANRILEALAHKDGLTGLANRRHLDSALEREFGRARRSSTSLAMVMIDVDCFKAYNDRYGHPAGDASLKAVANVVQAHLKRPADIAARYGGEEISVLLPDTDIAGATIVAEEIRLAMHTLKIEHLDTPDGVLTVSAGVAALTPYEDSQISDLVVRADAALYRAKAGGRDCVKAHIAADAGSSFRDPGNSGHADALAIAS